ncbi:MAG: ATP synthase F1 subunit delta [Tepidisphaeraceae bacterium]
MSETSSHSALSIAYARSLIELAAEQKIAEQIGQELGDLKTAIETEPVFGAFLSDPSISEDERADVLKRALDGKASPLLVNFLGVVNVKGRLGELSHIAEAYDNLLDEMLGKVEVDVTVAQKLAPDQLEQVRRRVSQALGKDAVIHQYVDDSIIGGLVLRVGDKLIDASVKYQLQAMREQLLATAPKG